MRRLRIVSCALLLFACTKESSPPAQTPAPDVVAIVLGRSITRSELGEKKLGELIVPPLLERFRKENGITATELEILGFMKAFRILGGEEPGEARGDRAPRKYDEEDRARAEGAVIDWKVDRRMYELYGGDVIFQQANPFEPVGAYRQFLDAEEKAGHLQILDPKLAKAFWVYFRGEHRFVRDPSDVDFSVPWWAQKK